MRPLEYFYKAPILWGLSLLLPPLLLVLGKPRWQLMPLYLLTLVSLVLLLGHLLGKIPFKSTKGFTLFMTLSILLSLLASLAFPISDVPKPLGPYEVGTRIYTLTDLTREEPYTEVKDDHRQMAYQIWYPATSTANHQRLPWIPEGTALTRTLARSFGFPFFMLDHTAQILSHSYLDAPIFETKKPYSVVLISHGWQGFRTLHTDFAEHLASHGIVAISIDHTYGAQAVPLQDGTYAFLKEEALPKGSDPNFKEASRLLMTTYGEDVLSVIKDLDEKKLAEDALIQHLDLTAFGHLGHSTGGGGGIYAAMKEPRILAQMGLDPWVEPLGHEFLSTGFEGQGLFIRSAQWNQGPNNAYLKTLLQSSPKSSLYEMEDTTHVDFTMAYMYSPLAPYIGFTGSLGPDVSSTLQKDLLLSFFATHLGSEEVQEALGKELLTFPSSPHLVPISTEDLP